MKISVILGTRPEIIKMSLIIKEIKKQGLNFFILHTGQHYSSSLDNIFFCELKLPAPKYNLNVGSGTHAEETARMLIGIERILVEEKPDIILVEGDTNSVLAGALAAAKLHIKIGHVEAGLRSYDRNMPEEINRLLTDHLSDYLFTPTEKARNILLREGIPENKIFITGNTIVDAVYQNIEVAKRKSEILNKLGLKKGNYFLVTFHRQENTDERDRLKDVLKGLGLVYQKFHLPLIYPIHPRTRRRIEEFELDIPAGIKLIEPVGFVDFLALELNTALVLTDSGGVQEESCILRVPCITLRNNTERPETLEVGSNILSGVNPEAIVNSVKKILSKERDWQNPFGDGQASIRIVEALHSKRKKMET